MQLQPYICGCGWIHAFTRILGLVVYIVHMYNMTACAKRAEHPPRAFTTGSNCKHANCTFVSSGMLPKRDRHPRVWLLRFPLTDTLNSSWLAVSPHRHLLQLARSLPSQTLWNPVATINSVVQPCCQGDPDIRWVRWFIALQQLDPDRDCITLCNWIHTIRNCTGLLWFAVCVWSNIIYLLTANTSNHRNADNCKRCQQINTIERTPLGGKPSNTQSAGAHTHRHTHAHAHTGTHTHPPTHTHTQTQYMNMIHIHANRGWGWMSHAVS